MYTVNMVMTQHHWANGFLLNSMTRVEDFPEGINSHMSVTKVSLQTRGHHQWFNLEKDGLLSHDMQHMNR